MDKDWGIKDSCIKGIDNVLAVSLDAGALLGLANGPDTYKILGGTERRELMYMDCKLYYVNTEELKKNDYFKAYESVEETVAPMYWTRLMKTVWWIVGF